MQFLVISASLNPASRSRILAKEVEERLSQTGHATEWLDLRDLPLPFCDGALAYGHPNSIRAKQAVERADGLVLASPIYNFDINATAKNLIELTGKSWENKVAGFLCAAGGRSSYMSVMSVANSLMLDFRTVILPRFVYVTGGDFTDGRITGPDIAERLDIFTKDFVTLTGAWRATPVQA